MLLRGGWSYDCREAPMPVRSQVAPVVLLVASAALNAACGDGPTRPGSRASFILYAYCNPSGPNVACEARFFGEQGPIYVTRESEWTAVPADVAVLVAPGVFAPVRAGEVAIQARYARRESSPHSFLVAPNVDARWLYYLQVLVSETDRTIRIPGAVVEMLDGYSKGRTCVTNTFGVCRIEPVLTRETFSACVAKDGYNAVTSTYRVDPPIGGVNSPSFHVILSRQ